MKRHFTLLMMATGLAIFLIHAATITASSSEKKTETDPVDLKGKFDDSNLRSGSDVITVEIQGDMIMANFHRDLGNVKITIKNGTGFKVFESTVNTSVQQQAFIPLSGLPSGKYTITFSNNIGSMYGEFQI